MVFGSSTKTFIELQPSKTFSSTAVANFSLIMPTACRAEFSSDITRLAGFFQEL